MVDKEIRGIGRSWTVQGDISDVTRDLMDQIRVIRFEVKPPSPVQKIKPYPHRQSRRQDIMATLLAIKRPIRELGDDGAWFVDTLNGLEKLHKVIIVALVEDEKEKATIEEEMLGRIYKTYPPLRSLRKMEVVLEIEMRENLFQGCDSNCMWY